jgi:hypothetical protein
MKTKLLLLSLLGLSVAASAQVRPTDGLQFYYPLWSLANPTASTTTTPAFGIAGAPAVLFPWRQEAAFVANNDQALGSGLLAKAQDRFLDFTPPNDNNAMQFINTSTADNQADEGRDNYVLVRQNDIRDAGVPVGYTFPESGSVSVWVYRDSWAKATNKTYTEVIINNGVPLTSVTNPYTVQLGFAHSIGTSNTPGLLFHFGGTGLMSRIVAAVPRTGSNLPDASWNHVVATWQRSGANTTVRIYLNGELATNLADGTDPALAPLNPAELSSALTIGSTELPANPSGLGTNFWEWGLGRALSDPVAPANLARDHYPFNGRMAEARFFRRAINACEADFLFKEGRVTVWTGRKNSDWSDPENWTATTSPNPPVFPALATRDGSLWGSEVGRFRTGGVPGPNQTVIIPYNVAANAFGVPQTTIPNFPELLNDNASMFALTFGNPFAQSSPNVLLLGSALTRSRLSVADGISLYVDGVVTAIAPGTASFLELVNRASFAQGPCGGLAPESTNPLYTVAVLEGARGSFVKNSNENSPSSTHIVHPNSFFGYNYWASPVRNAVADAVFANPYRLPNNAPGEPKAIFKYQYVNNLGAYNQYNALWQFVGTAETMETGRGYAVAGAGQAAFTGVFHNAGRGFPYRFTASRGNSTTTPGWNGFNLVGNPFPSAISLERFLNFSDNANGMPVANLSKLVANTGVYFWQDDGANFTNRIDAGNTNDYTVCTLAGCDVNATSAQYLAAHNGDADGFATSGRTYIPAAQGFFINVTANNSDIFFTNEMRRFASGLDVPNARFFRPEKAEKPTHVRLALTSPDDEHNSTLVAFGADFSEGLDHGYDGLKLEGNPRLAFYSLESGQTALGVQALPALAGTREVDLGYRAGTAGRYTISATDLQVGTGVEVLLYDADANAYHDLRRGAYSFTAQPGRRADRFVLLFRQLEIGEVDNARPQEDQVSCYPNPLAGSHLQLRLLSTARGELNVAIKDMQGHLVSQHRFGKSGLMLRASLDLGSLKPGLYLIETELNGQKSVQRFFKQ